MLAWLGITLGLSLLPVPTHAQDLDSSGSPGPLVTDRPTDSASPVLVPRRAFQLELGFKLSRIDSGSTHGYNRLFPDLLARYGVNRKVEARLVASGWTFESGDGEGADGFSDISLGTKIALAEERGRRPQMSLLVDVSLPTGARGVTNDYVIPKILFLGANTLSDRLGLTYNVGPSFVTSKNGDDSRSNVDLNYAVALSGSVRGPFSLFGSSMADSLLARTVSTVTTFSWVRPSC